MTGAEIGGFAFLTLFALLAIRVPIGVAMLAVGIGGYAAIVGWPPTLNVLKTLAYERFSSYTFSIVPLFLLMGEFAGVGGVSQALFKSANAWLGHRRGGVAMAAIGGSAGFGAIAGSSLATAATMAQVALPEMRRYGYSGALATGTLAAGGTLGILIPPSIVLVIYAILAEQNIAKLFAAAFIPGLLAVLGYMLAIAVYVRLYPEDARVAERQPYAVRFKSLLGIWPVIVIFVLVIGGIYRGVFTPTEAAAVGAFGTGVLALMRGKLNWQSLSSSLRQHRPNHWHDFFNRTGRRDHQSLFSAHALTAVFSREHFRLAGRATGYFSGYPGYLSAARLRYGQPQHDSLDHPYLLSHYHESGLWSHARRYGHLVRYSNARRRRGRSDNAAGGLERLHYQLAR